MSDDRNGAAGDRSPAASHSADPFDRSAPPLFSARLWPHRSMTPRGYRWFMATLAAGLAVPLLGVWGTPVALFLAPFLLGALGLVWLALRASYRSARVTEEIRIWPDLVAVRRREPHGRLLRWAANPYWVRLQLTDTPSVERYLTLRGSGRTIELGAFLTPEERVTLAADLRAALLRAASLGGPGAGDPA